MKKLITTLNYGVDRRSKSISSIFNHKVSDLKHDAMNGVEFRMKIFHQKAAIKQNLLLKWSC